MASASGQNITIKETEFALDPKDLTLKPGSYVFTAESDGSFPHDLHIVDPSGQEVAATSAPLKPGDKAQVNVTLKAGSYTMYCGVDSHRARGMQGTITVQ
jgi:plastocyanin